MQETSLEHFESHLTCIKGLLQQYKIESFGKNMSNFANELSALKYMVTETLAAGSNYLFAKYDSVVNETTANEDDPVEAKSTTTTATNSVNNNSAYNRILAEMAGLSAAQTVEQIDARRTEIALELAEKTKISTIPDFEVKQKTYSVFYYFRNSALLSKNLTLATWLRPKFIKINNISTVLFNFRV